MNKHKKTSHLLLTQIRLCKYSEDWLRISLVTFEISYLSRSARKRNTRLTLNASAFLVQRFQAAILNWWLTLQSWVLESRFLTLVNALRSKGLQWQSVSSKDPLLLSPTPSWLVKRSFSKSPLPKLFLPQIYLSLNNSKTQECPKPGICSTSDWF